MPKFYTLILFLMLSLCLYASSDTALLRHFTIENGLPSNNVYAVTQDKYGYIWFNTDNGVVKYNGYTFKLFTMTDGLPSNDVWKLYPDKRGRMWVSTHANKIGYIKDDKYKALITSTTKAIHPSYINCDENNVFFLLGESRHEKLIIVDTNDNIHTIPLDSGKSAAMLNSIGYDNTLISLTNDSTLTIRSLSEESGQVTAVKTGFSLWSFISQGGGYVTHYGGKLVNAGVQLNYFLLADSDAGAYKKIHFNGFGGSKDEIVYVCYKDDDSLTIITNKAVYKLNNNIISWRRVPFNSVLPQSSQIAYYKVDNFGNEWYSTNNNGAWCKHNLGLFLKIDNDLHTLYNTKFIGTISNGNTYWLDRKHNVVYELNLFKKLKAIKPPDNTLPLKVGEKSDSEFYLYTNKVIYVYNLQSNRSKSLSQYLSIDTVKRYNIPSDEIPLSTDTFGIKYSFLATWGLAEVKKNKWLLFNSKPCVKMVELHNHTAIVKYLDASRITAICYDSADNIYLLNGLNSLAIYNPARDKYLSFDLQSLNSLGINSIRAVACDAFSNVYLLDNDEIKMYNVRSRRMKYLKCNFNLADASIYVYRNYILIAAKFGIAYANIAGPLDIGKFHAAVNMNNYNRIYDFTVNKQGVIYLSTDKGIVDININTLINGSLLDMNDANFCILNINSPIHRRLKDEDTVNLSQDIDKIALNAVNLLGDGGLEYHYVIEGRGDWQQTATGEIFTGTLRADHFYKVRCTVQDNAWVSRGFSFYVYRVPYWWQRKSWIIIFWVTGVIVFFAIIFIAVLLTRYAVAKSNDRKRSLTELELRAIYAQINPHFIFNTLSATLYFINKRKFDEAYLHINKFSRLIRGYLKSSQERYITLADEIEMLKNYIELQKTRFEDKLEYQIEIDNKVPVNNIQIPSLLLQPLVENAINHGLFHRKEGGMLLLQFLQGGSSEELICIIDDNGVGRNRAKEIKESSTVQYDSYGTKLTKQLIDVFKEFEKMGIVLEYIDKQLPETGTIVKLTIKNIKYVA